MVGAAHPDRLRLAERRKRRARRWPRRSPRSSPAARARSDEDRAYLTARQSTLAEQETNATGVDTDAELQSLMLVEQAYAANARVLSVIDDADEAPAGGLSP